MSESWREYKSEGILGEGVVNPMQEEVGKDGQSLGHRFCWLSQPSMLTMKEEPMKDILNKSPCENSGQECQND